MIPIIEQLKITRQEQRMKQAELGEKLGLPQSHISKIEHGTTDPRLSTVADMARILDKELIIVPRKMVPHIASLLSGENKKKRRFLPDEESEE